MLLFLQFYPFFFLSVFCVLTLKICVSFLKNYSIQARNFKFGIHMDNVLLYRGINNGAHCFKTSLSLSIFLSFKGEFVSQSSLELF